MLTFKRKFWDAVLSGEKTQTLRIWKTLRIRENQKSYAPGIGPLWIDSIEEVSFEELTDADAIPDGFSSIEALRKEIRAIYGSNPIGTLYRVRFHLLPPEPKDPLGPKPVFYDTLETVELSKEHSDFRTKCSGSVQDADAKNSASVSDAAGPRPSRTSRKKGTSRIHDRADRGFQQDPASISELPVSGARSAKTRTHSRAAARKKTSAEKNAVSQEVSGIALWKSWGFVPMHTDLQSGTPKWIGMKNKENEAVLCGTEKSASPNEIPTAYSFQTETAGRPPKSALEIASRIKIRIVQDAQNLNEAAGVQGPEARDLNEAAGALGPEARDLNEAAETISQNETAEDRSSNQKPESTFSQQKRNAEPMFTEAEIVEKMIRRCRIHRNVCDWNHEPGKSQDFFALFIQAPRNERGVPILNGLRLRTLMRSQISEQDWEEICWIAAEVCDAWNEWQYAVEHWPFPVKSDGE